MAASRMFNGSEKNEAQIVHQPNEFDNFTVGIVQYMDHIALDSAREGFIAALHENGYGR